MNFSKYNFWYLFWGVPLFFLALVVHQYAVYQGLQTTYQNGTSYTAKVVKFDKMQIVTQNSSSVVLEFKTNEGRQIRKKLSLPVEITGQVSDSKIVPIRYYADSFQPVIFIAAYEEHVTMTLVNIAMALFALMATTILGILVHRWVGRQKHDGSARKLIIDTINTAES